MSRRDQITMSPQEVAALLEEERVIVCASNGRDGFPHLMPLWFVVRDGEVWAWTFAKSQKAKNMERDPRVTLQVETGEEYQELRGVMITAEVELIRDLDVVTALGLDIYTRYAPPGSAELAPEIEAMVRAQAGKRVAMRFVERSRSTWDHRKLAGVY